MRKFWLAAIDMAVAEDDERRRDYSMRLASRVGASVVEMTRKTGLTPQEVEKIIA